MRGFEKDGYILNNYLTKLIQLERDDFFKP